MNQPSTAFNLILSDIKGTYAFSPDQIIRLKAKSNYTFVFPVDHKPFVVTGVLKDYQSMLEPYGFIRTHRSHVVNPNQVHSVSGESITMKDDSRAEISRRERTRVLNILSKHVSRQIPQIANEPR